MLFADWSYCVDRNNDKVFLTVLIKSLCIKKCLTFAYYENQNTSINNYKYIHEPKSAVQ